MVAHATCVDINISVAVLSFVQSPYRQRRRGGGGGSVGGGDNAFVYSIWLTLVSFRLYIFFSLFSSLLRSCLFISSLFFFFIFIAFILLRSFVGSSSSLVRSFVPSFDCSFALALGVCARASERACVFLFIRFGVEFGCGAYQGEQ